jgi:DNA-binding NarL/FixJ family response regulator
MTCTLREVPHRTVALQSNACRFLVVEDNGLLASLLEIVLQEQFKPASLQRVATAREGLDACRATQPELAIVDLGLPDRDGRELIRELLTLCPATRVIVLTGQSSATLAAELLGLGARGYVDKAVSADTVRAAVSRVLDGGIYISANLRATAGLVANAAVKPGGPAVEVLNEREREIARRVALGLISKEIAEELQLNRRTVEKIRARILAKLELRDVPSLVRWCVKQGLV